MSLPVLSTPRTPSRGFTLVEIMIVVAIIGLLAALALPAFQRTRRAAQLSRIANDFRVFAQAFETYALQNGTWPNNAGNGAVPSLPVPMTGDFKTDIWRAPTAIGGRWNWDQGRLGIVGGISIAGFTCPPEQLAQIDARIDDGDLSTGRFIQTQSNRVTLVLEQ